MCAEQTYNLRSKKAGTKYKPFVGGLQVCLDLSAAFDLLPRQHLADALNLARVPEKVFILEQQLGTQWTNQHLTMNADDHHAQSIKLRTWIRPSMN